MSCVAVKVIALFSDEAKRIASASLIEDEVGARTLSEHQPGGDILSTSLPTGYVHPDYTELVSTLARFETQAEADLFVDGVKTLEADAANGFTSLVIKTHACYHETDPSIPCSETQIWPEA